MNKPRIIIIGAGPAGLGAAFQLSLKGIAHVTVIEKNNFVGGLASSFKLDGITVDYGSHRLHPACDSKILSDIRSLLGNELLNRPRHGRIRLRGRWIHFPLEPINLLLKLPLSFSYGIAGDVIGKFLHRKSRFAGSDTFKSYLERNLGKTICRDFYFPYARKLWGVAPEELSVIQAQKRISASSIAKILRKVISALPGLKKPDTNRFYYPKSGFGEISKRLYKNAVDRGTEFYLGTEVKAIKMNGNVENRVYCEKDGERFSINGDHVWSTIPISTLLKYIENPVPMAITRASQKLIFRAMILIYLVLDQEQFSEYDAHYFPELDIPISRISEPKNYRNQIELQNQTVLCGELPCSTTDPEWSMTDKDLGNLLCSSMVIADIPVTSNIRRVTSIRVRQAYPVYNHEFDWHFQQLDKWLSGVENLLTFGRQGLFVHDNTHHALHMGYAAAKCLNEKGDFDIERWKGYRKIFDEHLVED